MESKTVAPHIYKAGVISSAAAAFIASVLYIIAYHNHYDNEIRHFETGTVLPYVFGGLMALSAVIFTLCAVLLANKYVLARDNVGSAETFGLWLCGLMFLIFGFIAALETDGIQTSSKIGSFCTGALAPLSIVSAAPFVLRTSRRLRDSAVHAFSTFAPVLWGICLLFKYYFDLKEMPINDPELTLTMVSISSAVIFFLCECRFVLGSATPSLATFSASAALCLTGSISLARVVLWQTDGHMIPDPMETTLLLAVAVLAACRLYELASSIATAELPDECTAADEAEAEESTADTEDTEIAETDEITEIEE